MEGIHPSIHPFEYHGEYHSVLRQANRYRISSVSWLCPEVPLWLYMPPQEGQEDRFLNHLGWFFSTRRSSASTLNPLPKV